MTDRLKEFEKLVGGFYAHNSYILWVYFNPDAEAGGQIVINYINPNDIVAASIMFLEKDPRGNVQAFDDYLLENMVKCELIDIDDGGFWGALIYWLSQHQLASDEAITENRRALVGATKRIFFMQEAGD